MKKLLFILLAVIVLAGLIGTPLWWFLRREKPQDEPVEKAPSTLQGPEGSFTINHDPSGLIAIDAATRNDLFFGQGYAVGERFAGELYQLRRWFKGLPVEGWPQDLAELDAFWYFLDLEATAKECLDIYPPEVLTAIEYYAAGLNATKPKTIAPWQVSDILLLQRGYAFLLGHNFVKEWKAKQLFTHLGKELFAQMESYPITENQSPESQVTINERLQVLLRLPIFESIRALGSPDFASYQFRTHPALRFVAIPMNLELKGRFSTSGISLAGLPFLWSGATENLLFLNQAVLTRDGSFHQIPKASLIGKEGQLRENESASGARVHQSLPIHLGAAREMSAFILGQAQYHYFYYWDGFRPSADLATAYYLLSTRSVEEMITAYQYHQVPNLDVILGNRTGTIEQLSLRSSRQDQEQRPSAEIPSTAQLFTEPVISSVAQIPTVQGFNFKYSPAKSPKEIFEQTEPESPIDNDLKSILLTYLTGPLSVRMEDHLRQDLISILRATSSASQDYLVHLLWDHLGRELMPSFHQFLQEKRIPPPDFFTKNLLLHELHSQNIALSRLDGPGNPYLEKLQEILQKAYRAWHRAGGHTPPYPYQFPGDLQQVSLTSGLKSRDAYLGPAFGGLGTNLYQVSAAQIMWDGHISLWIYPEQSPFSLGQNIIPFAPPTQLSEAKAQPDSK